MNATRSFYKYVDGIPFNIFGPVIESKSQKSFLCEHPYKIMENGDIYDVPWITSNTKDEGLFPVRCKYINIYYWSFGNPYILYFSYLWL